MVRRKCETRIAWGRVSSELRIWLDRLDLKPKLGPGMECMEGAMEYDGMLGVKQPTVTP